jgi:hypothetical protein
LKCDLVCSSIEKKDNFKYIKFWNKENEHDHTTLGTSGTFVEAWFLLSKWPFSCQSFVLLIVADFSAKVAAPPYNEMESLSILWV